MGNIRNTYENRRYMLPPERPNILNALEGFEVDYYFMAKRYDGSRTQITMSIWVVVVDFEGFVYGQKTIHSGHYENWKLAITDMIEAFLIKLDVDKLFIKRTMVDMEIKKDGHLIPYNPKSSDRIGIDGGSELYIRKNRFSLLK